VTSHDVCVVLGCVNCLYDMRETGYKREHTAGAGQLVKMSISARQGVAGAQGDMKKRQGEVQSCRGGLRAVIWR